MLRYYGGSVFRALNSLFPFLHLKQDFMFQATRFVTICYFVVAVLLFAVLRFAVCLVTKYRQNWTSTYNRRRFFDVFSFAEGFDALVAENWYTVLKAEISQRSKYHNNLSCG